MFNDFLLGTFVGNILEGAFRAVFWLIGKVVQFYLGIHRIVRHHISNNLIAHGVSLIAFAAMSITGYSAIAMLIRALPLDRVIVYVVVVKILIESIFK